jgi:type IV pilus assembly protein PilB
MQFDPVDDDKLKRSLGDLKEKEEEALVERAAREYGIPYVDLSTLGIETDALRLIPEADARAGKLAAFGIKGKNIKMVVRSIDDAKAKEIIDNLRKQEYDVQVFLGSTKSLDKAFNRYADLSIATRTHGSFVDISPEALEGITKRVKNNNDVRVLFEELKNGEDQQAKTSRLIELIMGAAVATKTSDVHVEPQEEAVRLRYRQDGILEDIIQMDHDVYKSVCGRFKVLSGLKINMTKDAQDGRFTIEYQGVEIEVRVSTIPGPYGEGIVMRLLDPRSIAVEFDQLGIEPYLLDIFKREISKPDGIILTTGPTGSGKTTTLYTFLKYVYDPEIKVITIEDPIEYHLAGIQQTQIDHAKGYDFMAGLRAAMRQDPEVILVGEIRDKETAITAVQAAQTGHLVFSTLHTNNAAGVIPRLLALDVNPSLLASTLRLMIAQRLCRRLYQSTKLARKPKPEEEQLIRAILKKAEDNGKDMKGRYGLSSDMNITLYDPTPNVDAPTGYKGRVGIYEAIVMDRTIEELLEKNPTERQLRDLSQKQGVLSLAEDAIVKVLQGMTSLEEVSEVIDLQQDLDAYLTGVSGATQTDETRAAAKAAGNMGGVQEVVPAAPRQMSAPMAHMMTAAPLAAAELQLLVNYLKHLENDHADHMTPAISAEIQQTEETILELLKHHDVSEFTLVNDPVAQAQHELHLLNQDIESLQNNAGNMGTADRAAQLRAIRAQVEGMMGR